MLEPLIRIPLRRAGWLGAALFAFAIWAMTQVAKGGKDDLSKFCAVDERGARWHSDTTMETCDGQRMQMASPGSPTPPEHICSWLKLASELRVVFIAVPRENNLWEVRPAREFADPNTVAHGTRYGRWGPSDACTLYQRP